jgi:hypothetical protein
VAYGIETFGSGGYLQFSTEVQESLTVVEAGAVANNVAVPYNNDNEILCFHKDETGWLRGNHNDTLTSWTNKSGVSINWIKLKRCTVDGVSGEDSAGSYGLQVFNSSGVLTYSSNFSKGQEVLSVIESGSVASANDPSTASNNPTIYTGDPTNIYYGPSQMRYYDTSTIKHYWNNAYFDFENNKIQFIGVSMFTAYFTNWVPTYNMGSILIFKRKG